MSTGRLIAVVDYGMGNLRSVAKALEHVSPKSRVVITSDAATVRAADRVVFPGQGAMPDCMRYLAASGLTEAVLAPVRQQRRYTWVLNGRFKGGHITRSFGNPAGGIHAIQLEMSQINYMDETPPFSLRPDRCEHLLPLLRQCLVAAGEWVGSESGSFSP